MVNELTANRNNNPFIEIPPSIRLLLLIYFFGYVVLFKTFLSFIKEDAWMVIHISELILEFLIFLPIIFYRSTYGWLHPIIFPVLFSLLKSFAVNPAAFLGVIFSQYISDSSDIEHVALSNWSQSEIRYAHIKGVLIQIVALASYYFAYFYIKPFKTPWMKFGSPKNLQLKILIIFFIGLGIFFVYIQSKGGINSHLLSWSQGRFKALSGDGPIFVLVRMAPTSMLIWYALDKNISNKFIFWPLTLVSITLLFFLTGSRSSVIYFGILFFMVFTLKKKQLPKMSIILAGFISFIVLSTLGNLRKSTFSGEIDWDVFVNLNIKESLVDAHDEVSSRSGETSGYLPVVAKVPGEVDILYGESYVGTIFFFIPRAIWSEKPRGAGALSGERIFGKTSGAGTPTGAVGEAFWNFHIPGVIIIFILYGMFHKTLANALIKYQNQSTFIVIYVITLFLFAPTGISIVGYFQTIIPALLILRWTKAISF